MANIKSQKKRIITAEKARQRNKAVRSELKTAVSEAVTNAVVHAYPKGGGKVFMSGKISGDAVYITISDEGVGIEDVARAREPLYTGKPEEGG